MVKASKLEGCLENFDQRSLSENIKPRQKLECNLSVCIYEYTLSYVLAKGLK